LLRSGIEGGELRARKRGAAAFSGRAAVPLYTFDRRRDSVLMPVVVVEVFRNFCTAENQRKKDQHEDQ
jgi:hypothetical protein